MTQDALPPDVTATLSRFHFDRVPFSAMRGRIAATPDPEALHRITGPVAPPPANAVAAMPARNTPAWSELEHEGAAAIAQGELGVVILAGGMATRFGSAVKGLAPLGDRVKTRFIDAKLADVAHAGAGRALYTAIMTSFATDDAIGAMLEGTGVYRAPQFASLRLNADGTLFRDNAGQVSLHATGHGDLPEALALSGTLERMRQRGVKTVLVSNVDNLGATTDPAVFAQHRRLGGAITVELVGKHPGDKGGVPVVHDGKIVLAEAFRLPSNFPHDAYPLFNTNTLWIDLDVFEPAAPWTWCVVRKKVDGREAIQLERLVGELTWWHPTRYLHVSRDGTETRFLPVKERDDLERCRAQIEAVLRERVGLKSL